MEPRTQPRSRSMLLEKDSVFYWTCNRCHWRVLFSGSETPMRDAQGEFDNHRCENYRPLK